jgi:hypothetical protein
VDAPFRYLGENIEESSIYNAASADRPVVRIRGSGMTRIEVIQVSWEALKEKVGRFRKTVHARRWLRRSDQVIDSVADPQWREQLRTRKTRLEAKIRQAQESQLAS